VREGGGKGRWEMVGRWSGLRRARLPQEVGRGWHYKRVRATNAFDVRIRGRARAHMRVCARVHVYMYIHTYIHRGEKEAR